MIGGCSWVTQMQWGRSRGSDREAMVVHLFYDTLHRQLYLRPEQSAKRSPDLSFRIVDLKIRV